jgi:hypothetical protein
MLRGAIRNRHQPNSRHRRPQLQRDGPAGGARAHHAHPNRIAVSFAF